MLSTFINNYINIDKRAGFQLLGVQIMMVKCQENSIDACRDKRTESAV